MEVIQPVFAPYNSFSRVHFSAGCMPTINAQSYALVVAFYRFVNIVRGGEAFVFRPMIMDGKFNIILLYHLIQYFHRSRIGAAHNGRYATVFSVFKSTPDISLIIL